MRSLTVPENEQLTRLGVGSDAGTGGLTVARSSHGGGCYRERP
jgi:hypothetical protein